MPATAHRINVAIRPSRHLTAADLDYLPNGGKGYSIVRGEIMFVREPAAPHSWLCGELSGQLWRYVKEHRLGRIGPELHVVLTREGDTVLSPDIAFVRRDRIPDPVPNGYFYLIPDLVIEVLSPGNTRRAMAGKMKLYLDAGVPLGWVIDGERSTVTVYRAGADPVILTVEDTLSGDDVIPGFEISVKDVFTLDP